MPSRLRLVVVYDDDKVYCEFDTEEFKNLLVFEYYKCGDIEQAFNSVKEKLKQATLRV